MGFSKLWQPIGGYNANGTQGMSEISKFFGFVGRVPLGVEAGICIGSRLVGIMLMAPRG